MVIVNLPETHIYLRKGRAGFCLMGKLNGVRWEDSYPFVSILVIYSARRTVFTLASQMSGLWSQWLLSPQGWGWKPVPSLVGLSTDTANWRLALGGMCSDQLLETLASFTPGEFLEKMFWSAECWFWQQESKFSRHSHRSMSSFFFKFIYLFWWDRGRACKSGEGAEKGGDGIWSRLCVVSMERCEAWTQNLINCEIMTWAAI